MATRQRIHLAQRRRAMGFTQESLAERLHVDRTTVVRWERGETEPQPWFRRRLAVALSVSLEYLDLLLSDKTDTGTLGNEATTLSLSFTEGGDVTDRRQFAFTAAVAALGIVGPLRGALAATTPPSRIGTDHLRWLTATTEGFEQADAALGGDAYCDVAIGLYQRVSRWEREASYGRRVGQGLQAALGDLEAWAGWLALDSERRPESQHYLQAALVRARLTDDAALEVRALQQLSMLLRDSQPAESLRYAEAALRVSTGWASPRLATLLHLRAARAHASLHDQAAFQEQMDAARSNFDKGIRDDDPAYLGFVSQLEIAGIEGLSHLVMGQPAKAAETFRAATERPEPVYLRNHGLCSVRLAEAVRREGDVTGASQIALAVLPKVTALRSTRTSNCYAELRQRLGLHADDVTAARDFTDAYDEAIL